MTIHIFFDCLGKQTTLFSDYISASNEVISSVRMKRKTGKLKQGFRKIARFVCVVVSVFLIVFGISGLILLGTEKENYWLYLITSLVCFLVASAILLFSFRDKNRKRYLKMIKDASVLQEGKRDYANKNASQAIGALLMKMKPLDGALRNIEANLELLRNVVQSKDRKMIDACSKTFPKSLSVYKESLESLINTLTCYQNDPELTKEVKQSKSKNTVSITDEDGEIHSMLASSIISDEDMCLVCEGGRTYHNHVGCFKKWSQEYRQNFTGWNLTTVEEAKEKGLRVSFLLRSGEQ